MELSQALFALECLYFPEDRFVTQSPDYISTWIKNAASQRVCRITRIPNCREIILVDRFGHAAE